MSAQNPRRRLPISCEPCRIRKIRCPRDGPPCGTCLRRPIPPEQCAYSSDRKSRILPRRQSQQSQSQVPLIGRSAACLDTAASTRCQDSAGQTNADLNARIKKLEQMVYAKSQMQPTIATQPNLTGENSAKDGTRQSEPATAFATGTLIHFTSGHVRFLPSTSGWRIFHHPSQEGSFASQDNIMTDTPTGPYPFGEHDAENRPNLLAILPPTEYCDQLKNVYFQSFAPLFPILHSPTFHERYHQFSQDPDQVSLAWLALLFSILGTSVLALEHDSRLLKALSRKATPWDRVTELSERYYTAAMKCLEADRYLWRHNLSTLQALVILIYGIHHSHGQTWTLLGLVYHLALSIGCHVDPAAFSLDIVESEERRRCWLGLTALIYNQNMAITGFDIHQSVFSSPVQRPAKLWDKDIIRGQPEPVESSVDITPVFYLIRKSRLFQISSEICNPVLAVRSDDPTALRRLDAAIRAEIDSLEQSYVSMVESDLSVVHTNLLLIFAHHLILLLHGNMLPHEWSFDLPHHSWSKHRCMESAQRVLELHADFHKLPLFTPFLWYIRGRGAFYAFHAAVILVLMLSIETQGTYHLNVVRLLHECHDRLQASKGQSKLCARTANILGQILSSRLVSALGPVTDILDITPHAPVSQGAGSDTQIDSIDQPQNLNIGHVHSSESVSFPSLALQIEPQQWINPGDMDWDQWDLILSSLGTTN